MLLPLYSTLVVALLFYLILPVTGAVLAASGWRRFRKRIAEISRTPILGYRAIAETMDRERGEKSDSYRMYGTIEAMAGDQRIWVRGDSCSALVDLSASPLYVLAPGKAEPGSVRRFAWKSISSLAAGTRVFVAGRLHKEHGRPVFADLPEERLIAVTYDGVDDDLVPRLIVGGRGLNEYWTSFGPLSLALGMTISSGLLLILGGHAVFSSVRALAFLAAMIPVLPLLPPGLVFFLLYRRLWRRALRHRTRRDVLRLSDVGGTGTESVEGRRARSEQRKALVLIGMALLSCCLAVLLNYILAFMAWRSVL